MTTQIPGEHFVINKTSDVPRFLKQAQQKVGQQGALQIEVHDIEGCYPNMPKEAIRFALRSILKQNAILHGYDGVYVP